MTLGNMRFRRYGMPFAVRAARAGSPRPRAPAARSSPPACSTPRARGRCFARCSSAGSRRRSCSTRTTTSRGRSSASSGLDVDGGHRGDRRRAHDRRLRGRQARDAHRRGRPDGLPGQGSPDRRAGALLGAVARVRSADGRRLEAGGFQTIEAYDVLIANLDPTLERRAPAEDPLEALARFPAGLVTQEVAAIMAHNNIAPDRAAAERALIELAGAGARAPRRRSATTRSGGSPERAPTVRARRVASSAAMSITVTLPDGKALELARRRHRRRRRRGDRPGPRARRARGRGEPPRGGRGARGARPRAAAARRRPHLRSSPTKSGEQALELIRHDAAHVLAAAPCWSCTTASRSRSARRSRRLLLRLRVPGGHRRLRGGLPADRRAHARARQGRRGVRARGRAGGAGARALRRRAPGLQGRADRRPRAPPPSSPDPLETVSLYTNGPFTDLCRGPHAPSTTTVGAFKLQSVAGAYWRGDSARTMLTRIYGTAFFSKAELTEHLERLEQARARDHRKLGRELDLFMFSELSPGSPFWKPAGMTIWNALTELWRSENRSARLQRGEDADPLRRRAVEAAPGTGTSTRTTCTSPTWRSARWA